MFSVRDTFNIRKMKLSCKTFILFLLITCFINHSSRGQTESYSVRLAPFSSNKYDEFSPVYYKHGIVFCSNRKNDVFITYSTSKKKELLNMYYVKLVNDSINLESIEILSKELMTNFNDGPATFNKEVNVIYYSRNNEVNAKMRDVFDPKNKLGIYSAELMNGKWTNIKPFKYNSLNYSLTTPSLAPDGKRLYFASDMPGGFGGADLYYCKWNNNDWDEPVNLGKKINTTGNEAYPFASKSGELYFSSDGHKGLGKKDIFFSREVEGEWITPIHLDPPINSKEDDFGLITDLNLEEGYFSSRRKKTDDIFSFKTEIHQFYNCDSLQKNHYCFLFYDEGFPDVDTLPLRYEWDFGDGEKVVGLEVEHCFPGPGEYSVQLNIVDNNTGNTFFTQSSYNFELEDIEQPFINSPDAGVVGNKIDFDGLKTNLPDFEIADYIWNFGDGFKAKGPLVDHTYGKKGEYMVQLGLLGKKDSLDVIPKTCVYKKINIHEDYQAWAMHTAREKGEIEEIPEVEESDQSELNTLYSLGEEKEGDEVFRVQILASDKQVHIDSSFFNPLWNVYEIKESYIFTDSIYSYTVGEESNLLATFPIYNDVISRGYSEAQVMSYILAELTEDQLSEINKKFEEFADAYFEFDYYEISAASYPILNKVVQIMNENPSLKLEIAAHTDNIGSFEYNMNISERRAQSIVNLLASKGISVYRLNGKGYGESRPIAGNNTEEGRKMNRRVEFIIINE